MSERLVELFRAAVEAWNRGDRDAVTARFAPDARVVTARGWPGGGSFEGRDEVNRFFDEFADAWEIIDLELLEEPRVVGECVLCHARWAGRGRESGIETTLEFHAFACFEADLIRRWEVFWTEDEALSALG